MRRRYGQMLRVGVGSESVSLLRCGRWHGNDMLAEWAVEAGGAGFDGHAQALRAVLEAHPHDGWPVAFVLDDTLARLWQVQPPPLAGQLSDLQMAAALRFELLFGESTAQWQLAAGWDARQAFFAAAVPRALLAVLQDTAAQYSLAVVGIAPHFINAWNRWRTSVKDGAWFGLLHGTALTLGAVAAGRLCAVRPVAVPPQADLAWLGDAIEREVLLLDLPAPTLLQMAGRVPPTWCAPRLPGARLLCQALEPQALPGLSPGGQLAASGSRA